MVFVPRRRFRVIRYILLAFFFIIVLDLLSCIQFTYPKLQTTTSAKDLKATRSVYIASTQWNSGKLLEEHWIPNLLQTVKDLKAANIKVLVSIYENGSWDSTKSTLSELRQTLDALGVRNQITLDDKSHEYIIAHNDTASGWLRTAYGTEMRRIPYLASVRNEALMPLHNLTASGERFDKLIFLNDVIFSPSDVWALLNTNDGQYAAACALDFLNPPWNHVDVKTRGFHPPGVYDDFATRDSNGNILGSHLFPYFTSALSKKAVISGHHVPVQSCWNGMVAFDASPFQKQENPLRFRAIPDTLAQYHVEASECCLIHYDNPISAAKGIYINPAVRVAYSIKAYEAVSSTGKGNGIKPTWPTKSELLWGHWKSRWIWWARWPASAIKVWWRIKRWKSLYPGAAEPGLSCASDLAMVLTSNGWTMRGGRFE
ncbi:MAG: hypothetical protein Q9166_002231 [cf. Caloplaca sp. 2 TL-2023]